MKKSEKKVLFLAYYYPPMGGAGVQRVAKFVKYLPSWDFDVVVVSGTGYVGSKYSPAHDKILEEDVKGVITYQITSTPTECFEHFLFFNKLSRFIPGMTLFGGLPGAQRVCEAAVKAENPDVIFVSVSPFQAANVVATIAKKYNIPWVLDMRDPWALDPIYFYPTRWHYCLDLKAMRRACCSANAIVMNTPRSLEELKKSFPDLSSNKLFCITNGWDSDDIRLISKIKKWEKSTKLTIVHTGYFQTEYAVSVAPNSRRLLKRGRKKLKDILRYSVIGGQLDLLARSPYYLFKAIRQLLDSKKITENDIRLVFVGAATTEDFNLTEKFGLEKVVEFKGYVNHIESLKHLFSADVLFLPLHKPGNGLFPLIVPGKTYEYIAARKAILALMPPGDARDVVQRSGLGFVCDPTDVNHIAQTLLELLSKYRSPAGLTIKANERFIGQFERKVLTGKLAEVLNFAVYN